MFHVNDWVVYGTSGVYCVVDTDLPDPTGSDSERRYYELQSAKQKCRTYVPMDSTVRMRPILSKEEAEDLIRRIPELDTPLCAEHGKNAAEKYYRDLLQHGDCAAITGAVHKLSERRRSLIQSGRHMSFTEEKFLRRGRELLEQRVFHLPRDSPGEGRFVYSSDTDKASELLSISDKIR